MRKCLRSVLVVLVMIALLAGCALAPAPATPAPAPAKPQTPAAPAKPAVPAVPASKEKTSIRMFGAGVGGSHWVYFSAMAFLAEKHSPWLKCEVVSTKGVAESLFFLLEKKGSVAGTKLFLVQRSYEGKDEYKALGPRKDAQLITTLAMTTMAAVVLDKSPIKAWTYADLKGKTIATREVGSSAANCTVAYLKAAGLEPVKDVRLLHGGMSDCMSALLDGTADAFSSPAGHPSAVWQDMFATKPCRFITFTKELIDKANKFGLEDTPGYIPANMYKGQKEPVLGGEDVGWAVTRADVSDDIIYEVTRLWWDYMDERNEISAAIAMHGTVSVLKAYEKVAVPYHKAALKYYREKGWFK